MATPPATSPCRRPSRSPSCKAGILPNWASCSQVAAIVHDRKTAYADIETEAKCLELPPADSEHAAALDR